jgi:hypothetical protein
LSFNKKNMVVYKLAINTFSKAALVKEAPPQPKATRRSFLQLFRQPPPNAQPQPGAQHQQAGSPHYDRLSRHPMANRRYQPILCRQQMQGQLWQKG